MWSQLSGVLQYLDNIKHLFPIVIVLHGLSLSWRWRIYQWTLFPVSVLLNLWIFPHQYRHLLSYFRIRQSDVARSIFVLCILSSYHMCSRRTKLLFIGIRLVSIPDLNTRNRWWLGIQQEIAQRKPGGIKDFISGRRSSLFENILFKHVVVNIILNNFYEIALR